MGVSNKLEMKKNPKQKNPPTRVSIANLEALRFLGINPRAISVDGAGRCIQ
jgi:hypothetical protein